MEIDNGTESFHALINHKQLVHYTYHYDRANRLVKSDYSNPTENRGMFSVFGLATGVKTATGDFKDNTIAYDANSNFLNMNRNMGANQSAKNLSYSYFID